MSQYTEIDTPSKRNLPIGFWFNTFISYAIISVYWAVNALSFGHQFMVDNIVYVAGAFCVLMLYSGLLIQFRWRLYAWLRTLLSGRAVIIAPAIVYLIVLMLQAGLYLIKSKQPEFIPSDSLFNYIFHGVLVSIFLFNWLVLSRLNDAILLQIVKRRNFITKSGLMDVGIMSLVFWLVVAFAESHYDTYQQSLYYLVFLFLLFPSLKIVISESLIRHIRIYLAEVGDRIIAQPKPSVTITIGNPYEYEEAIIKIVQEGKLEEARQALEVIRNVPLVDKYEALKGIVDYVKPELKEEVELTLAHLKEKLDALAAIENRYDFLERSQDIQELRALIRLQINQGDINVVIKALNDTRKDVKKSAILVAGYLGDSNFIPLVISQLDDPQLCMYARHSLIYMNLKALKYIEVEFFKRKNNPFFTYNLLGALSGIEGERAEEFLLSNIYEPNITIQLFTLKVIIKKGIRVPEKHMPQVKAISENLIGSYIFLQNILNQINPNTPNLNVLIGALEEEKNECYELLQSILKTIYNPYLVDNIFSLLGSDDFFKKYFGLNYLEIHFSQDLRNKLRHIFAFHNGRYDFSKVREEFLGEYLNRKYGLDEEILLDVMQRDYNKISNWSKACALMSLVKIRPSELWDEIASEFFSGNQLLNELASMVIYRHFVDEYILLSNRLDKATAAKVEFMVQQNLMSVNEQKAFSHTLLKFNKVYFLHKLAVLRNYSPREINVLEKLFEVKTFESEAENFFLPNHQLTGFWIIESGSFQLSTDTIRYSSFERGDILDFTKFNSYEKGSVHFKKSGIVRYFAIDELAFINVTADLADKDYHITTIQPQANQAIIMSATV
ncbi:hypothetical protein QWY31_16075 [Cytophagales bacterium LB-30]|uniref:Cyclic nucleotide-binding domain-containing protein n=1 Tax=Shiella aurantiaca TaxID=3058365 RepID=A0ABT8F9I8_9BACT|nr:hypothetical protein [Shiella aurantiaca]MDN4167029.1 hypothetical protein [Shiella aurantiaca]